MPTPKLGSAVLLLDGKVVGGIKNIALKVEHPIVASIPRVSAASPSVEPLRTPFRRKTLGGLKDSAAPVDGGKSGDLLKDIDFSDIEMRALAHLGWGKTMLGLDPAAKTGVSGTVGGRKVGDRWFIDEYAFADQYLAQPISRSKTLSATMTATVKPIKSDPELTSKFIEDFLKHKEKLVTQAIMGGTLTGRVSHRGPNTVFEPFMDRTKFDFYRSVRERQRGSRALVGLEQVFEHQSRPDFIQAPFVVDNDPEIAEALVWGPYGEFVGVGRTSAFSERWAQNSRGEPAELDVDRGYGASRARFIANVVDGRLHPEYYRSGPRSFAYVARAAGYDDLIDWCGYLMQSDRDSLRNTAVHLWANTNAQAAAWASAMFVLKPKAELLRGWIKALEDERFAFGYGLLRDEDDRFDALGVLAELNDVDWRLNTREGGYVCEGDAYTLKPARVADFLGIELIGAETGVKMMLGKFNDSLIEAASGTGSHKAFGRFLREALEIAERLSTICNQSQHNAQAVQLPSLGDRVLGSEPSLFADPLRWRS